MPTDSRRNDEQSTVECPTCGRLDFNSTKGMKIHHASAHDESIAGEVVHCDFCGGETRTPPSKVEQLDHHFCDERCEGKWRSNHLSGPNAPQWNGGTVTVRCPHCGDEIERHPHEINQSDRNFCDATCRGQWRSENWSRENFPVWKGGKVTVECDWCSVEVERRRDQLKKYERSFCSDDCLGEWRSSIQRGQNNPVWTGGRHIREAIRRLIGNSPWTKIASQARKSECGMCKTGTTSDGRQHAVHHIVPLMAGGCNEPELLMTLCPSCHRKVEAYTRQLLSPVLVE